MISFLLESDIDELENQLAVESEGGNDIWFKNPYMRVTDFSEIILRDEIDVHLPVFGKGKRGQCYVW